MQTKQLIVALRDVDMNWCKWFHFLILKGGLLVILIDLYGFSVTIPEHNQALEFSAFSFTYDLNGFKSRINIHLLTVGSS